ncbi:MAG: shikimate kinase [Dehalococcoidia bacterium]
MKDQVWLIGFMGTGKSRVSRPLAAALEWDRVDIDALIEQEAGEGVRAIFARGGEGAFRALEEKTIERVAEMSNVVVATGGGAVTSDVNREAMHRRGFVVCLDARVQTIADRLLTSDAHVSERPLLKGDDPVGKISSLKAEREALYRQADFIVQTDDMSPDQITHQILLAFREQAAVPGSAP